MHENIPGSPSCTRHLPLSLAEYNSAIPGNAASYLLRICAALLLALGAETAHATGGNFVWAKAMGGTGFDLVGSLALDGARNVYTAGQFYGTVDFDPGVGIFNLTASGYGDDTFLSKLDRNGNFVWANAMGSGYRIASIAVDVSGNVYATGLFYDTVDFDPGAGVFNLTSGGGSDIFVSKLDTDGNLMWAKAMRGSREVLGLYTAS